MHTPLRKHTDDGDAELSLSRHGDDGGQSDGDEIEEETPYIPSSKPLDIGHGSASHPHAHHTPVRRSTSGPNAVVNKEPRRHSLFSLQQQQASSTGGQYTHTSAATSQSNSQHSATSSISIPAYSGLTPASTRTLSNASTASGYSSSSIGRRPSFSQQCQAAAAQSDSALSHYLSSSSHQSASTSLPVHSHIALPAAIPILVDRTGSGRNSPLIDPNAPPIPFVHRHPSAPPVPMHVFSAVSSTTSTASSSTTGSWGVRPPPSPNTSTPSRHSSPFAAFGSPILPRPSLHAISPSTSASSSVAQVEEISSYEDVARFPPHLQAATHRRHSTTTSTAAANRKKLSLTSPMRCQTSEEAAHELALQQTRQHLRTRSASSASEENETGFPFSLNSSSPRSSEAGGGYELEFEM